ncbi:hypothetical protein J2W23_005025 [Variovorax boronicumulans]|nr:hypothetical protein [Variovorax boronicumulans]
MSWSRPYSPNELEWLDDQAKAMAGGARRPRS